MTLFNLLGNRRNSASGNIEHARLTQHSTYTYNEFKNQPPSTTTKGVHRKNSFCHSNSENSLTLSQGHLSNGHSKKTPQPLLLRRDLVTYSDGSYCLDNGLGLSAPTSPSNPFSIPNNSNTSKNNINASKNNNNDNSNASNNNSARNPTSSSSSSSIQLNQSVPTTTSSSTSSSTSTSTDPSPSLTTSFSTSKFSLALLSNQRMGTVVLPDLVILTNEIPWCSVASEFAVLTADDIAFDLFGNYSILFYSRCFLCYIMLCHFIHHISVVLCV